MSTLMSFVLSFVLGTGGVHAFMDAVVMFGMGAPSFDRAVHTVVMVPAVLHVLRHNNYLLSGGSRGLPEKVTT